MSRGRQSHSDNGPVWSLPHPTHQGNILGHKGHTVRPQGVAYVMTKGLVGLGHGGSWVRSAGTLPTSKPALHRAGRVWGNSRWAGDHVLRTDAVVKEINSALLCEPLGWQDLGPRPVSHTLTSSSSSASANSKALACTVLGTGALLLAGGALHSSFRLSQEPWTWGRTPASSRRASISV